jgi:hypothetical protein
LGAFPAQSAGNRAFRSNKDCGQSPQSLFHFNPLRVFRGSLFPRYDNGKQAADAYMFIPGESFTGKIVSPGKAQGIEAEWGLAGRSR